MCCLSKAPRLDHSSIEKTVEILQQAVLFSADIFVLVVDAIDDALDHIFCPCLVSLMPLIQTIVTQPFAYDKKEVIASWFTMIALNLVPSACDDGSRVRRVLSRRRLPPDTVNIEGYAAPLRRTLRRHEARAALPYLSFAKQVACETTWREGTEILFERALCVASSVVDMGRQTIAFGVAFEAMRHITPIVHADGERHSQNESDRASSKRPRDDEGAIVHGENHGRNMATAPSPRVGSSDGEGDTPRRLSSPQSHRSLDFNNADSPENGTRPFDSHSPSMGESPRGGVVSWCDRRLSLQVFLTPFVNPLGKRAVNPD
jgi:hypothetical protein